MIPIILILFNFILKCTYVGISINVHKKKCVFKYYIYVHRILQSENLIKVI